MIDIAFSGDWKMLELFLETLKGNENPGFWFYE
jgi:hypothetical protein